MTTQALPETADFYRVDASLKLDASKRAQLGQYMTPAQTSRFMASLISKTAGDIRVLDAGAGVGSLTAALAERLCAGAVGPRSVGICLLRDRPDSLRLPPQHARAGGSAMPQGQH